MGLSQIDIQAQIDGLNTKNVHKTETKRPLEAERNKYISGFPRKKTTQPGFLGVYGC